MLFDEQRTANRYNSDFFSIRSSTQNHDFVVRANSEQHNRAIDPLSCSLFHVRSRITLVYLLNSNFCEKGDSVTFALMI